MYIKELYVKYDQTDRDEDEQSVSVLLTVLGKVEAVTGQSPSLPVMKGDQKMLALTADALNLDHNQAEEEAEADIIFKPPTQRDIEPVRISCVD